jgi:hypothetical protein
MSRPIADARVMRGQPFQRSGQIFGPQVGAAIRVSITFFLSKDLLAIAPRKLSENTNVFSLLSVTIFRVFDAWKPLLLHHQHIKIRP